MDIHSKTFKYILLIVTCIVTVIILGRNINPFSSITYSGHDETQAARIHQFTLNLQQGNIPPRIAPEFSYGLGYPVFTYYAPFSYWVTSVINLTGIDIPTALKLSYLLTMIVGFSGIFLLLKRFFPYYSSLLGAVAYISSPYIATEIFVRGNLAEMWFFALFPLSLYLFLINNKKTIVITSFILSFLFTSHNILSLITIPFSVLFIAFTENKRLNFIAFGLSMLLSAYFYVPLFAQLSHVHASQVAKMTDYRDHFLCPSQLWTSLIGFAGSAKGCNADGMSFMLGKLHILFGGMGILLFIYAVMNKSLSKRIKNYCILFALVLVLSVIFTFEMTLPLWNLVSPLASLMQFPWRLLLFSVFGLSFFTAYAFNVIQPKYAITALGIIFVFVLFNSKFFYGQPIPLEEFNKRYLSRDYIRNEVAFHVPEYLPTDADYDYWRSLEQTKIDTSSFVQGQDVLELENKPFSKIYMVKSNTPVALQIHYAPYWYITKNNEEVTPEKFDKLGRPILDVSQEDYDAIHVQYKKTVVEQLAEMISLATMLGLGVYLYNIFKPSWKHMLITVKKV